MDHPTAVHFDLLRRGKLPFEESRLILSHLSQEPDCGTCVIQWLLYWSYLDEDGIFVRSPESESTTMNRADRPLPALLWVELSDLSPKRRDRVLRQQRYRTPAFARWLIGHSLEISPRDPDGARLTAETARAILRHLGRHSILGEATLRTLQGMALASLGHAYRCLGQFREAKSTFRDAEHKLATGEPDRHDQAQFLSLRARLFKNLGCFNEAAHDLRRAFRLGCRHATPHRQGRLLLQLADVAGDAKPEVAVRLLDAARARLDFDREPRLELVLAHRRAWFLNDSGQPDLAQEVLRASQALAERFSGLPTLALRFWLSGRIERSLGNLLMAQVNLHFAVASFRELGQANDQALAGFDLADLHLLLGSPQTARQILDEATEFLKKHLHAECMELWLGLARNTSSSPVLLYEAVACYLRHWSIPGETEG